MTELALPDGWTVAPGADGHTVATKFIDGNYRTVEVSDGNDLAGAVQAVEQEAQLRARAQADERRRFAAELRAEADRVDPDVETLAPVAEPVPEAEVPAPPVVVPIDSEVHAAPEVSSEPASALAPDPPAEDDEPSAETLAVDEELADEGVSTEGIPGQAGSDSDPNAAPVAATEPTPTEGA